MSEPEYTNRAKPGTHNAESIDRSVLSANVIKLLDNLEALPIIAPRKEGYSNNKAKYNLEDETIRLSERQLNLAKVSSEGYGKPKFEMFVEAGYSFYAVFAKKGNWGSAAQIKQELTSKYDLSKTETVDKMINHLRYNGAVELHLDAKWLLNEQVDLYSECRRKNMYTQAVRLLHDISYHIDIDARVSNKLEVSEKVDYAALLNNADERAKSTPSLSDKSEQGGNLIAISPEILEGEFEELESPVDS